MSTSSAYRRRSEKVSIQARSYLSEDVVTHTELLKTDISCLQGANIRTYEDLETF